MVLSLVLMVDGDVLVEGAVLGEVREDVLHEQVDGYEHQHDGNNDAQPQGARAGVGKSIRTCSFPFLKIRPPEAAISAGAPAEAGRHDSNRACTMYRSVSP